MPVVQQQPRPQTTAVFPNIILVASGTTYHAHSELQQTQHPHPLPSSPYIHCGGWHDALLPTKKSGFPTFAFSPPPPSGLPVISLPNVRGSLPEPRQHVAPGMPNQQPQPMSPEAQAAYGQRVQRALKSLNDQLQQAHHREPESFGDDGTGGSSLGSTSLPSPPQQQHPSAAGAPPERLLDLSRIGVDARSALALCDAIRATFVGAPQKDSRLQQLGHHLTGISLSHNSLLDNGVITVVRTILGLSSPAISSSSSLPPTAAAFSQVTCLDLFGVGLTDAAIPPLIDAISQASTSSTNINREANRTTSIAVDCSTLPTRITKLKLGDNAITGLGIQTISAGLWGPLRGLNQLHIGGNPIDGSGLHALAAAWTSAPHSLSNLGLRDIKMAGCESTSRGLVALLRALGQPCISGRPQLRELQLRGTALPAAAVEALSCGFRMLAPSLSSTGTTANGSAAPAFLCPFEGLQCLDLTACEMTDAVCDALLQQIYAGLTTDRVAMSLRELHLSSNRLGAACAASLGRILSAHPTALLPLPPHLQQVQRPLQSAHVSATTTVIAPPPPPSAFRGYLGCPLATLNIAEASLTGQDIAVLFEEWQRGTGNCNLNCLNLSGNVVSQVAADCISRILRLQHVSYCYSALGLAHGGVARPPTNDAPAPCAVRRVQLSTLVLASCNIDPPAATTLFDTLACFPGRLRVLEMPQNRCGNTAVPSLCRMLQENHVVAKLQLQDNGISELSAMEAIEVALSGNPTIRSISMGGQSALANNLSADMRSRITANCERNKRQWLGGKHRAEPQAVVPSASRRSSQASPYPSEEGSTTVAEHRPSDDALETSDALPSSQIPNVSGTVVEAETSSTATSTPWHDTALHLPDLFAFLRA